MGGVYGEKMEKKQKKYKNIWSCQKKVVPLHAFLRECALCAFVKGTLNN